MVARGKYSANGNITYFPTATNMLKLIWDSNLADGASSYAHTCPRKHSKGDYGENIIILTNTEHLSQIDIGREASYKWFNEFQEKQWKSKKMNFRSEKHQRDFGHATQMIWQSTRVVGCGFEKCNGTTYALVCRYKPRGNMEKGSIYEIGTTCTQCPEGTYCESGLCTPND
ncbi:unnamed protein product [Caenorhabditis angaria]|uniref:SCP domain-containing protein n=1 Tax=Caenorhabditis angaria TaxID=860376 RepID=A0A9P1IQ94_9PELO|nr:unnamed protein product [Caenorhabditis angaria]